MAGGFLIDRNRRGQTFNRIHVGLVHLAQKLPGVGREAFDVTTLALGKNRVESQGTLAASAYAGEHHQLVAGNGDVHVFEVVLAGATHPDHVFLSRYGPNAISALGNSPHHETPIESKLA